MPSEYVFVLGIVRDEGERQIKRRNQVNGNRLWNLALALLLVASIVQVAAAALQALRIASGHGWVTEYRARFALGAVSWLPVSLTFVAAAMIPAGTALFHADSVRRVEVLGKVVIAALALGTLARAVFPNNNEVLNAAPVASDYIANTVTCLALLLVLCASWLCIRIQFTNPR